MLRLGPLTVKILTPAQAAQRRVKDAYERQERIKRAEALREVLAKYRARSKTGESKA